MDIQSVFYLLASIFMLLGIAIMVAVLVLIWRVKHGVDTVKREAVEKIHSFASAKNFAGVVPFIATALKWAANRRKKENS